MSFKQGLHNRAKKIDLLLEHYLNDNRNQLEEKLHEKLIEQKALKLKRDEQRKTNSTL